MVKKINAEREAAGLEPLSSDLSLDAVAEKRAREIAEDYRGDHTRPDGSAFNTAVDEAGIAYVYYGENIAEGYGSVSKVMDGWMDSDGHKANILHEKYTAVGIGRYEEDGTVFWVQEFISAK